MFLGIPLLLPAMRYFPSKMSGALMESGRFGMPATMSNPFILYFLVSVVKVPNHTFDCVFVMRTVEP